MKINEQPAGHGISFKGVSRRLKCFSAPIRHLLAVAILFCAASAVHGQTVIWDASGLGTGGSDGSGIWEGATNWFYSGTDQGWPGGATASTGPTAVIGAGVPGNYVIMLTQPESALFFTNTTSGYTLGGDELTLTSSAANATPGEFSLGTGVTLTVTNQIGMSGGYIVLGSGATLNYGGPKMTPGGNARIYGQDLTSVVNLTNGFGEGGTLDLSSCTVNLYGGSFDSTGRVDLGRGVGYGNGQTTVNVYGGDFYATGSVSANNGHFQICRGNSAQCALNLFPGGTVSSQNTFEISPDSGDNGAFNMSGGYLYVGAGGTAGTNFSPGLTATTLLPLTMMNASSTGTQSAIMNLSGGVVDASEILLGASGTFSANTTCRLNMSGGYFYLDAGGIQIAGGATSFNPVIDLSGGTFAATASWTGAVPMTLTSNLTTFQTGDTNGDPFAITLTGAVTGPGNLQVTGPGVLTLNGPHNYTGTTTVSDGALVVATGSAPSIGPVILAAGTTISTAPAGTGQNWTCASLNVTSGSTVDFNYGSFLPSSSQAPVVVSGLVQLSSSDTVSIEAGTIFAGTYPLIQYGTFSGSLPATLTLPSDVSATLVNNTASQTIELVVSSAPVTIPAVEWNVGSGVWNINSTLNWKNIATHTVSAYQDGDEVEFFDDGQPNPIVITLNTTVNPESIFANNVTNSFLITGTGGIGGTNAVTVQGTGVLALATTNTYTGGTTVSSGTLAINYGGDGLLNSAIGTGSLVWTNGGQIDNTSGKSVTLATPIAEFWYGNIGFVGSTNLTLGSMTTNVNAVPITLGQSVVATVSSNRLIVNSPITSSEGTYSLTKRGAGALVLNGTNTFSGGVTLDAGELDINFGGDGNGDSAIGTGPLTINGGIFDNTSGDSVTNVEANAMTWGGTSTFKGTTNLDLGAGAITVVQAGFSLTLASNTLYTEGTLSAANGTGTTISGSGTWVTANTLSAGIITMNGGTLVLNSPFVNSLGSGGSPNIHTGALLIISNATGTQIIPGGSITLSGGTFDINGDSGETPALTFNSGVIQDSGGASGAATVPAVDVLSTSGNLIPLGSATCTLSSPMSGRTLDIPAAFTGSGSLTIAGLGTVSLGSTNTYTGDTTIGPGTLALYDSLGSGFLSNSPAIILSTSTSALDMTGNSDSAGAVATLTLNPGQTLSGFGTVTGLVVALGGATVAPGSASAIGTITVTTANSTPGASALNGTLLLALNRTNAQTSSSVVFAAGNTVTYGGTLSVTNIGPALHVGDVFHLFPSAVTTFASISLPTTDASGNTYTWNNNVAGNGSITVASVTQPINPNSGKILFGLSGNILSLSWPTNGGWILQTNAVSLALTNAWYPYPGSTNVTSVNINIGQSQSNVFFRLAYP